MEQPIDKLDSSKKLSKKFGIRHVQSGMICLMVGIAFGTRSSMSVAIVAMTDGKSANPNFPVFDWDFQTQSLILSSLLWGCLLTQTPIGYLISNGGLKKFLCICFFLNGLATILIPIAAEKLGSTAVICCRVLIGMCQGCVTPCSHKVVSCWVPPAERARLGSFALNGAQLGTVIYMTLTGTIARSALGWPGVFYIFGIVSIVWSVLFQFLGADTPCEHSFISPDEVQYINCSLGNLDKTAETKASRLPWKSIIKSIPVWALLIVSCGQAYCYYVFQSELPSYMTYVLKFNVEESGQLSALPYLATWLITFPVSWLSDYAMHKNVPVSWIRKISNSIGMWVPAAALLALTLIKTDNKTVYVVMFILAVGFNAGVICGLEINLIDLSPNFASTLVSMTNTVAKLCGLLSPIVCGYILHDMSDENQWHTVFYMTVLVYFVTNLIFLLFGTAVIQPWNEQMPVVETPYTIEKGNKVSIVYTEYDSKFKVNESIYL